ncbi:MAG: hypothetical protein QOE90_466 [Thermoplasmata archaeon]|jgi:hypothetical protein|nr:hypothetical protein [Thermoplasmata archaeon]
MSEALPLLVEELFDVEDAIRDLESRKETLRAAIRDALAQEKLGGIQLARGSISTQTLASFRGLKPSMVLPLAAERGWVDEALQVNGRGLHRVASPLPTVMDTLRALGEESVTETIVVRRAR